MQNNYKYTKLDRNKQNKLLPAPEISKPPKKDIISPPININNLGI